MKLISDMVIGLFQPPAFEKRPLDLEYLEKKTGKKYRYASKGRYAITHIIQSFGLEECAVLCSVYMCNTVYDELKRKGYQVCYYDIDPEDLNPDPNSIREQIRKTNAKVVIVPSLYGNPADLPQIERICREEGVYMIDDGAQSFGATIDGRYVSTFGDGGLIGFSPGKATAGHMGAIYWSTYTELYKYNTSHVVYHYMTYLNFLANRQTIYSNRNPVFGNIIKCLMPILTKNVRIENDRVCEFEEPIIGGLVYAALNDRWRFRKRYLEEFLLKYGRNDCFRIIKSQRGEGVTHKIVLVFPYEPEARRFKKIVKDMSISFFDGYNTDVDNFDGYNKVKNCIVELPIEDCSEHMDYVASAIDRYLGCA